VRLLDDFVECGVISDPVSVRQLDGSGILNNMEKAAWYGVKLIHTAFGTNK
jgi:hypothetical protein